jgi:hypothetical protein
MSTPSLARWATGAVLGLIITMCTLLLRVPGYVALWQRPDSAAFNTTQRSQLAELAWTAFLVATGVAFAMWLWHAHRRVAVGVRLRHWWAFVGWLIPVLNFLMPYLYVKETYEAAATLAGRPRQVWLGLAWWLTFIGWLVANTTLYTVADSAQALSALDSTDAYSSVATTGLVSSFLGALAAGLAIGLIRHVTQVLLSAGER